MIEEYIGKLKEAGEYDSLAVEVKKLNLSREVFDAFGTINEERAAFDGRLGMKNRRKETA